MNKNCLHQIIEGCRRNDSGAQKRLYQLFYRYTFRVVLNYTSSLEEAREIVNDVFLKIFRKIHDFNSEQPFKPWLTIIAAYTAIDYYRKHHKKEFAVDDLDVVSNMEIHSDVIARISVEELYSLVQQLSQACRSAIHLYAIEGYEHHEIAQMLDISVGTSKSNLFKARAKLRAMLRRRGEHGNSGH
jgi:RNA polymerase sigma factor (sigma-70 family)